MNEAYRIVAPIDTARYPERKGLEGPFRTKSGKVVYYDPKEGKYYDPDSDFYIPNDQAHDLFNFVESQIEHDIAKLLIESPEIDFAPGAMDYDGSAIQHRIKNGSGTMNNLYTFTIEVDANDSALVEKINANLDLFGTSNNLLLWSVDTIYTSNNLIVTLQFRQSRLAKLGDRRGELDPNDIRDDLLKCYSQIESWLLELGCNISLVTNGLNTDVIGLTESNGSGRDTKFTLNTDISIQALQDSIAELLASNFQSKGK